MNLVLHPGYVAMDQLLDLLHVVLSGQFCRYADMYILDGARCPPREMNVLGMKR